MISKALTVGAYHGKLREIAKLGVDLSVVVPERWGSQQLENIKADGYELRVMPCRFTGAYHFHYYPLLSSVIEGQRWNLVHIDEEPFNLATWHAMRLCQSRRTRAIFFTWQNILKRYPLPFNVFEKSVFHGSSGAIAGNTDALGILRQRRFSKAVAVIPQFGVDPEVFCMRGERGLRRELRTEGSFVIGYLGRIVREKGLDTLVRSLTLLPGATVLVLAGDGPYRAELEELIQSLDLTKRVRWVPWVDSRRVPEYMNAFDVLVLPSRTCRNWKEQFGRVLIEAMACETCVVGSDSGEIPNVIGEAGLVFHEGDEQELAGQLRHLMDDSALSDYLRLRGRERVLKLFTHTKIAQDTFSFYKHVCSGSECVSG